MALIQVNFVSNTLKRTVPIQVILPVDKIFGQPKEIKEYKTLYLLHGLLGNYTDWVTNTRIQMWAEAHDLCVVMPSGDNSFYINGIAPNNDYGKFIGEELVAITRKMFPLSHQREDTFIAGLSMGGFGALRNGLFYPETFGYIAGLSSALNMFEQDPADPNRCLMHEDCVFGDLETARQSDKNPRYIVENYKAAVKPEIYMCVGTEDSLIDYNKKFRDCLIEHGFHVTYEDGPGIHNWVFWDTYIQHVLAWLPLNDKSEGMNSGHTKIDD